MKIRKATSDDLAAIRELLRDLDYPCSLELLERRVTQMSEDKAEDLLVAEDGGKVLGVVSIHYIPQLPLEGDFARISYFCVHPTARGQGVGKTIEQEACRRAQSRGCDRLELHCHSRRASAQSFYLAQGYMESPKYFVKHIECKRGAEAGLL